MSMPTCKMEVIWPYEELLHRGPGHDYIYSLLTDNIDARFLEACATGTPRLKMVANMAVGYNNIDVEAATRLGIALSNTPGVLSDTTADLAFGLLMATARRIPEAERYLRAGKYKGWGPLLFCGAEVHRSTLGLIGAGRIGKIVAKRASGFEMKVLYYDVYRMSPEDEATYHMTYMPMDDVLKAVRFYQHSYTVHAFNASPDWRSRIGPYEAERNSYQYGTGANCR